MLAIAQLLVVIIGIALMLTALICNFTRTQSHHTIWRVWIGRLHDLNHAEFRLYCGGIAMLLVGLLLQILFFMLRGM